MTTKSIVYGSYAVSISICLMFLGYLVGFMIQYRSIKRLIQLTVNNTFAKWIISFLSLLFIPIYFLALIQALVYFWGCAAHSLTMYNYRNTDKGCLGTFEKIFMDDKHDPGKTVD